MAYGCDAGGASSSVGLCTNQGVLKTMLPPYYRRAGVCSTQHLTQQDCTVVVLQHNRGTKVLQYNRIRSIFRRTVVQQYSCTLVAVQRYKFITLVMISRLRKYYTEHRQAVLEKQP